MFRTRPTTSAVVRSAGLSYFPLAFVARLPFAMMTVGVLTLVVAERGSVTLGGLNSAVAGIGTAFAGPLLGAAADRFGQRRVLVPVGLLHGALLAAFPLVVASTAADAAVLALSVLIGMSAPQVAPMSRTRLMAVIRRTVQRDRRRRALDGTMAYESAADEMVFIVGPFLVGLLATAIAPWVAIAGAAALTLVFVTAFALHPTGRLQPGAQHSSGTQAPARELARFPLLTVVAGTLGVGLFFGATLTSLTGFLAADGGSGDRAGLLYGVMGIGSAVLALGTAALPQRFTLRARWAAFGSLLLAGALLYATARSVPALVVALAVLGCGVGPTLVTLYSVGALLSPAGRSATTMTMLGSAVVVGQALASAVTGVVVDRLGTATALAAPALAAALVVAAAAAYAATQPRVTPQPEPVPA
ncbi:MFS transporter [Blastococcus sp. MG754426]|uniref:MFS transporter n=1 Tax=unclassified Blastococcus TaxID=2619396 RepID=UPI001EF0584B|nr:MULTISPECIES: MFS transporter [unclassified Blastococcus]MCF6509440.1 MFS transporter [Blastococcus sp. MG754426]MCF6513508.1 MFS transporter [Blastococcus sp. MG754427]MCF6734096.1 MFS transporter [Blastococcus sp. KM273129]